MRLVRFDGGTTGLLVGEGDGALVVDVPASAPDVVASGAASWAQLIEDWDRAGERLRELEALAASGDGSVIVVSAGQVSLEAPLPEPAGRIFAMGGNFPMHTAATAAKLEIELSDAVKSAAKEAPPWGFYVIPGTVVGPGAVISPPRGTQKFDYEAEIGVVLTGEPVREDGTVALWGHTAWNDFSIRDAAFGLSKVDHGPLTWSLQKNFTSANACGPWMLVDGSSSGELRIVCRVNGEVRQDGNTRDMKYDYGEIATHISEYLPLRPGDMILSGTPGGTAMEGGAEGRFLQDGDVTEVEVDGIGILRNRVALPG